MHLCLCGATILFAHANRMESTEYIGVECLLHVEIVSLSWGYVHVDFVQKFPHLKLLTNCTNTLKKAN